MKTYAFNAFKILVRFLSRLFYGVVEPNRGNASVFQSHWPILQRLLFINGCGLTMINYEHHIFMTIVENNEQN